MCLLSLPYPTTFIEEMLVVVEVVMIFGSGVAGLSVLTHTHTPPARSSHALFTHAGNTILLSMTLQLLTHIQFCILSISCSPSRRNGIRVPPHAQEFPGFTPMVFFSGFLNSVAVPFTHGLIRGFSIVVVHTLVERL